MEETNFDYEKWLSSSLFTHADGGQTGKVGGKVGKHLLGHWLKRLIKRLSLQRTG